MIVEIIIFNNDDDDDDNNNNNNNTGQSNLAISDIAANWGFRSPNLPFPWGTGVHV